MLYYIVSLHQTTTLSARSKRTIRLYYIVSLHQTTTADSEFELLKKLYYIVSLHQTTTRIEGEIKYNGCIISFLYIKPQPSPHANN